MHVVLIDGEGGLLQVSVGSAILDKRGKQSKTVTFFRFD